METAYNELLEMDVTATSSTNINTLKKVKSPVARIIQKLRKSGSSDSEIIEYLLDTDSLTKSTTPRSKEQETGVRLKRQEVMFTATPSPIKRVLQPGSSEMAKPQKQLKRTVEMEKVNNEERIPIK